MNLLTPRLTVTPSLSAEARFELPIDDISQEGVESFFLQLDPITDPGRNVFLVDRLEISILDFDSRSTALCVLFQNTLHMYNIILGSC